MSKKPEMLVKVAIEVAEQQAYLVIDEAKRLGGTADQQRAMADLSDHWAAVSCLLMSQSIGIPIPERLNPDEQSNDSDREWLQLRHSWARNYLNLIGLINYMYPFIRKLKNMPKVRADELLASCLIDDCERDLTRIYGDWQIVPRKRFAELKSANLDEFDGIDEAKALAEIGGLTESAIIDAAHKRDKSRGFSATGSELERLLKVYEAERAELLKKYRRLLKSVNNGGGVGLINGSLAVTRKGNVWVPLAHSLTCS